MVKWFGSKKPAAVAPVAAIRNDGSPRTDSFQSMLSGLGVDTYDKRLQVVHQAKLLNAQQCSDLWRGNDIAARVVETIPNEALRQGFEVKVQTDDSSKISGKEISEKMSARMEELNVLATVLTAKKYERAFGGAAIFPVINDGSADLRLPLNEKAISAVQDLMIFEPTELQPASRYTKLGRNYGRPDVYRINSPVQGKQATASGEDINRGGLFIHETRLIMFHGIQVSRQQNQESGFGDSVLNRVYEILRDYDHSWAAIGHLLHDFSQSVMKIKGLMEYIATNGERAVQDRIRAAMYSQSVLGATIIDSEEEFERKQTSMQGLPDMMREMATRLAAACDMPLTLLMGQSPGGLNATGESDIRFFYDRVASVQELGIRPQLERLAKLLFLAKDGPTNGIEPDGWCVEFNPLWQPSEKEVAEVRKLVAETDAKYIEYGVVDPSEVSEARFGGDAYSMELSIDTEERAKLYELSETQGDETQGKVPPPDPTDAAVFSSTEPAAGGVGTGTDVQATALNGAQVTSLVDVVAKAGAQEISRESAQAILEVAFRVSPPEAARILGPANFKPEKPAPAPSPFGGPKPPFSEGKPVDGEDKPPARGPK